MKICMIALMEQQPHYHGHRQRLKEKFRLHGADAMADYEVLELLLMQAIPRRDVKPLAKEVLVVFKTFSGVLEAPLQELASIKGMGESSALALKLVYAGAVRYRKSVMADKKNVSHRLELLDYLYTKMGGLSHEEFHLIYLDTRNNILAEEKLFSGTLNAAAVYPREVVKAALKHNAHAVVLVHNHPSGNPSPSPQDQALTMDIQRALLAVDIEVYDHLIVGHDMHFSFRDHGML